MDKNRWLARLREGAGVAPVGRVLLVFFLATGLAETVDSPLLERFQVIYRQLRNDVGASLLPPAAVESPSENKNFFQIRTVPEDLSRGKVE